MSEDLEKKTRAEAYEIFSRWVKEAADRRPEVWCIKRQSTVQTASLRGEECLTCPEWIFSEGPCDPLWSR